MRRLRLQRVTGDPLKRGESPLLGVYATTTLRKGRGRSSPPSDTTNAQVVGLNAAFGVLVVPERWSQRYQ